MTLGFADSAQVYYAEKDVAALKRLCAEATDQEASLLCRYRLYPLTKEPALLDALPEHLEAGTPRAHALLAGLWGFRAADTSPLRALRSGLLSDRLLQRAKAEAPHDPYVLLIEGQSLLFRPALMGGDLHAALDRFRTLQAVAKAHPDSGVAPIEAEIWIWYALARLESADADAFRQQLLARPLPRLYQDFLHHARPAP